MGLGGPSAPGRRDSVFAEGGKRRVEEVGGTSKNGSLGARARVD